MKFGILIVKTSGKLLKILHICPTNSSLNIRRYKCNDTDIFRASGQIQIVLRRIYLPLQLRIAIKFRVGRNKIVQKNFVLCRYRVPRKKQNSPVVVERRMTQPKHKETHRGGGDCTKRAGGKRGDK